MDKGLLDGVMLEGVHRQSDPLVNLPDLTVGASVPFAEMIASGMAT